MILIFCIIPFGIILQTNRHLPLWRNGLATDLLGVRPQAPLPSRDGRQELDQLFAPWYLHQRAHLVEDVGLAYGVQPDDELPLRFEPVLVLQLDQLLGVIGRVHEQEVVQHVARKVLELPIAAARLKTW